MKPVTWSAVAGRSSSLPEIVQGWYPLDCGSEDGQDALALTSKTYDSSKRARKDSLCQASPSRLTRGKRMPGPTETKMPRLPVKIRPVSLADVRQLASILNTIFSRDPGTSYVFGYPSRNTPGHHAAVQKSEPLRRAMMYRQMCNPDVYVHSAYTPDLKNITGFAIWAPPSNDASLARRISPGYRLLGMLIYLRDQLFSLVYPTFLKRILEPETIAREERKKAMIAADQAIEHDAIPASIQEQDFWQLIALGVSEEYERRGIGSQLLQWGCDKADETDHAVFITASVDGEKLYSRHGFEVLRKETLLKDVEGGSVPQIYMIRWPKSQREKMSKEQ